LLQWNIAAAVDRARALRLLLLPLLLWMHSLL
jgi:hypothetical protein